MSQPTFASWRDRLTYLLGEYKLLVSGMILGAIGLIGYYQPQAPDLPSWIPAVLVGWLVFALPCYLVGSKIARWLRSRNWVEVHHVNALDETIEKHMVPPQTWNEKEVPEDAPGPYPVNDGTAWGVREFEYLEEIDQLRVEGVWLEGCEDDQLLTSKAHIKDIHGWLDDRARDFYELRGAISRKSTELQGRIITSQAEASERGQMIQKTMVKDVFGDFYDIDDESDIGDHPTIQEMDDIDESHQTIDGEWEARENPRVNGDEP